jgi:hypothetical protein
VIEDVDGSKYLNEPAPLEVCHARRCCEQPRLSSWLRMLAFRCS